MRIYLGGVIVIVILIAAASTVFTGSAPPDIHLVVVESLSADHMPCYGYERNTTPHICQLARDSVLFEHAYSQGTRTAVSVPVLLTGKQPSAVGVRRWNYTLVDTRILPDILVRQDYGVRGWKGLTTTILPERTYPRNGTATFHWQFLRQTHYPYHGDNGPPRYLNGSRNQLVSELPDGLNMTPFIKEHGTQALVDLYDSALHDADEQVGTLVQRLKQSGTYQDSLIIVTGDHGELQGEHGDYRHANFPTREQVHVPLIVKFPDNRYAGRREPDTVGHINIMPTILDLLGLSTTGYRAPLQEIFRTDRQRYVVSATVRHWQWAILNASYRLQATPKRDCDRTTTGMLTELCRRYNAGLEDSVPERPQSTSKSQLEQLEDMGYLQ